MKKFLFALLLVGGCSSEKGADVQSGNATVESSQRGAASSPPSGAAQARLTSLTGLYEGGTGTPRHQMCIVERGNEQRFGLVVWGGNLHSCSGSGTVTRQGNVLKLAMAGDSACTIDGAISGTTVTLPETVPAGCSYYCGARATLGGAALTQSGTTEADALKAKDIVGDPLCGGETG